MKVKFLPQNVEIEITPNQSVMEVARDNNIFIKSVCNGVPNCAECRVNVVEGEHNVAPPSHKELSLIGTGHFIDQRRLSCQLICFGDITVDLSEQLEKEKMPARKPQGFHKKAEDEVSVAVTGNLIDQESETLDQIKVSPDRPRRDFKSSKPQGQGERGDVEASSRHHRHKKKKKHSSHNRNRSNQKNTHSGQARQDTNKAPKRTSD